MGGGDFGCGRVKYSKEIVSLTQSKAEERKAQHCSFGTQHLNTPETERDRDTDRERQRQRETERDSHAPSYDNLVISATKEKLYSVERDVGK